MSTKVMWGIVGLCVMSGGGCATMFTGSTQQVTVSSQPPGARVFVNGSYSGVTPVALLLRSERDYAVTLQREGYRDTTAGIVREFNPVAALNLFSLVCWVVDFATGAIWRLTPITVYAVLQPAGMAPPGYQPPPGWGPPPNIPVPSQPPGEPPAYGAPPPGGAPAPSGYPPPQAYPPPAPYPPPSGYPPPAAGAAPSN